jgi:hypothetical protein
VSATIARGLFTDVVLATLETLGRPVGDTQFPAGGAWRGAPNGPASEFVPYVIVTPLAASRSSGAMGDSQSDWQLPYAISAYGSRRDQCELMADDARTVLDVLRDGRVLQLGPDGYKVQLVLTVVIGSPGPPAYATDPPIWTQHDQVSLWLTKELA